MSRYATEGRTFQANLLERDRPASKRYVDTDEDGVPLTLVQIAAGIHDLTAFEDPVDAYAPVKVDQGYVPKSARWQHRGGTVCRAAGRGHRAG